MSRIAEALKRAQSGGALDHADQDEAREALANFPGTPAASPTGGEVVPDAAALPADVLWQLADPDPPAAEAVGAESPFKEFSPLLHQKLVVSEGTHAGSVEQYRRLAAALHHAQTERGIRIVMIASTLAGEGKTLTATNLALTLSESYHRRVLLVDADLRRPMMHETFQVPNVTGLNDALKAQMDRRLAITEISPRLSLLPAGRPDPDPMSGLTSDRMRRLIREAAERFDWVILDTPPVGLLPDANLLAAMADVVVLVVDAGRTPCAQVQKSVGALGRDRIIGVLLNRASDDIVPGGGYGYYYGGSTDTRGTSGARLGPS